MKFWRKTKPVRNDFMWNSLHELAALPQWESLLVYVEALRDERMSSMLTDRASRDALAERASELNDLLLNLTGMMHAASRERSENG